MFEDLKKRKEYFERQILDSFLNNFPECKEQTKCFEDIPFDKEKIEDWKHTWIDEIVEVADIERRIDKEETKQEILTTLKMLEQNKNSMGKENMNLYDQGLLAGIKKCKDFLN